MDKGDQDHFKACSRVLALGFKLMPEGFSSLISRREAEQGRENIDITETLTDDGTGIITVRSQSSSWDVSLRDLLSDRLEEELQWYLEEYAQWDPLDTSRARSIAEELNDYGRRLFEALDLGRFRDKLNKSTSLLTISIHHPTHGSAFPKTLWEALEESSLWSDQAIHAQVIVRRVLQGEPRIRARFGKTFNILYVVARPGMAPQKGASMINLNGYIDHRLLSKSVVQTVSAMHADSVQVELQVVRPGTFRAFRDHLIRVRNAVGRPGQIDLVHFDMHGRVGGNKEGKSVYQLGFLDGDTLQTEWIDAPDIAKLLKWHGIPAALVNACESANTRQRGEMNLAQVLVQHGVAVVVAMSFKLSTSAAQRFIQAFYKKLLDGAPNYNAAVLAGRNALRSEPTRTARLGLTVPVQDWVVPVLYTDTANTVVIATYTNSQLTTIYTLEGHVLLSPTDYMSPQQAQAMLRLADSPPSPVPDLDTVMGQFDLGFVGRDLEILWIETLLCWANTLRIYGPPGVGKTCLVHQLAAWWTRTFFASYVIVVHCASPDYLAQLDELVADRCTILGVEMSTVPRTAGRSGVPDPPRILVFDGLDALDESVSSASMDNDGPRFSQTCDALPSLIASGAKLVFVSRKPRFRLEVSRPDSALARALKNTRGFELGPFSPPDAAAFGLKLLADKGETIGQEDIGILQSIYDELDNLPGAIERVMAHCSLRGESKQPRRVLEKLWAGIPFNEIASADAASELTDASDGGNANMQLSMLLITPFSHRIFDNETHDDLLDYLSWPAQHEGFVPQVSGGSHPAVETIRRIFDRHGRPEEFAGVITSDSEGVTFARQQIMLIHLLDAIETFTSLGYIIQETKRPAPALWIHPALTAFLRHRLRAEIPQMKPPVERSFVHFMLKTKFSPESWSRSLRGSIPEPGQVSVREFLDGRIQREPGNYVHALVLGADLINEKQGEGVVISLADYLDALRHILVALCGQDEEKWIDVVIPVGERVVYKHFLGPGKERLTQAFGDEELKAVLSVLEELSTREIRVKRKAGHRSASRYLKQAFDIGEMHRLVGESQDILERCKDTLRRLTGEAHRSAAPGPADGCVLSYIVDLQDLAIASRHATTGDEAVLKHFRARLFALQETEMELVNKWEQRLVESLDMDRNDNEFAEIALAYGRYIDHENDAHLSEMCFGIERQMARQGYAEAKRLALQGVELSLDAGNRYGEFDFRRYLVEISECASAEGLVPYGDTATQLGEVRALAVAVGVDPAEWCVCWRHVVRAERAVAAGKDMVAARRSYLLALREAYGTCEVTVTHLEKVADELIAKEILPEATLLFLELCRQQMHPTDGSYEPGDFLCFLKSLFEIEPAFDFFQGGIIFRFDAGALQDLQALSGLSEKAALLEPLIRAYLALLDACSGHETEEGASSAVEVIARRQQHSLLCAAGQGDATQAATMAPTFSVTNQRFSLWMDMQMQGNASHADCVKRTVPPWGRFDSVRYGITAGGDKMTRVIVGPDSSDEEDEVEP